MKKAKRPKGLSEREIRWIGGEKEKREEKMRD